MIVKTGTENLDEVYELLKRSFPSNELRTYSLLKDIASNGWGEIYSFYDEKDNLLGVITTLRGHPGYICIDYLAVKGDFCNKGLGAKMLKHIVGEHKEDLVFIDVEDPDYSPNKEMATRRIGFYEKCGFKMLGIDSCFTKVRFKTMAMGKEIASQDLVNEYYYIYNRLYSEDIVKNNIHFTIRTAK